MTIRSAETQFPTASSTPSLDDPRLYLNRELSWLQFNARVLEEAEDTENPLLERVKFLSIFSSNLDEFFMIRISGLREQLSGGVREGPPDGMTTSEQLAAVRQEVLHQLTRFSDCYQNEILPKLKAQDVDVLRYHQLQPTQQQLLRGYFSSEIFPALTPLAFDPSHPFPHISNLSLNLAVVGKDPERGECFARVKIPNIFPRLVRIPSEDVVDEADEFGLTNSADNNFVWIEEILAANLDLLFPGITILAAYPFRVTRDADFEIEEDEAADLLASVEEQVDNRHFGSAIRLEIDQETPDHIRDILIRNLSLAPYQVYTQDLPLGLSSLMELTRIDRSDLKYPPFLPEIPDALNKKENLFSVIRRHDVVLYHPYDGFTPVIDFVREAASDPNVLAIKQTLYRVGVNSPIVEALMEARANGKQVAVLLELKARFDEENNIEWARKLEDEGIHVVYGVLGLKTHAKMCLVIRRDEDSIRRYVHLGTGNYNPVTSRMYTDLSFFTCAPSIGADVSDLFNSLTGYSRKNSYVKLLVAPQLMREQILERIDREIQLQKEKGDGYLAFKMNALVDQQCIQALYRASQAGVKIDLQVRGVCGLRPGIPGVSETVTVTSVVGRFLEHARLYYFRNGWQEELFLGSADLMPRNLERRVELLFPIESPQLRKVLVEDLLQVALQDNVKARQLLSDGQYTRLQPVPEHAPLNSQEWFLENWKGRGTPDTGAW